MCLENESSVSTSSYSRKYILNWFTRPYTFIYFVMRGNPLHLTVKVRPLVRPWSVTLINITMRQRRDNTRTHIYKVERERGLKSVSGYSLYVLLQIRNHVSSTSVIITILTHSHTLLMVYLRCGVYLCYLSYLCLHVPI